MSPEDQGTIMARIDIQRDGIGPDELYAASTQTQEVLVRVAQYSQLIMEVQIVCDHLQQIIDLQLHIMNLQRQQYLAPQCDHLTIERQMEQLNRQLEDPRRTLRVAGTDEQLQHE